MPGLSSPRLGALRGEPAVAGPEFGLLPLGPWDVCRGGLRSVCSQTPSSAVATEILPLVFLFHAGDGGGSQQQLSPHSSPRASVRIQGDNVS